MEPKVLIFLSFLVYQLSTTVDAYNYVSSACTNTRLNYTTGSTFEKNLSLLFTNLTSKTSLNFYSNSVGDGSDKVYALFQCRFDVGDERCNPCVGDGTRRLTQECHLFREAIVWYKECMVRYADRNIFYLNETLPGDYISSNANVTNDASFGVVLDNTMNGVIKNASSTFLNYASSVSNLSLSKQMYSFAQCTPDINSSGCTHCLATALHDMVKLYPSSAAVVVFYPSCQLWYNTTGPFLYDIVMPPPAPPPAKNSEPPTPTVTPPGPPSTKTPASESKTAVIAGVAALTGVGLLVLSVVLCICVRRKKPMEARLLQRADSDISLGEKDVVQYDFATLRAATGDFSAKSKLGEGGFGGVYKGALENGEQLAIKRLSDTSGQGNKEFKAEVRLLAKLQHRNLVRLKGFCSEGGEKLLVYEFLSNSSLERFLFDPEKRPHLNWVTRHKNIVGIARGLQYLHEDSRLTIIHRDLKPENILLDDEMNPKIADFGLARHFEHAQTFGNTIRIAGTRGYMAPECLLGEYSSKSDVYSFGVMLLEIVSGQSNRRFSQRSKEDLPIHAWILWNEERSIDLVDPELDETYTSKEIERFIQIGLLCVQADEEQRPSMTEVVLMLTVSSIDLTLPSPPVVIVPQLNVAWANPTGQQSSSDQFSTKSITHDLYPNPR